MAAWSLLQGCNYSRSSLWQPQCACQGSSVSHRQQWLSAMENGKQNKCWEVNEILPFIIMSRRYTWSFGEEGELPSSSVQGVIFWRLMLAWKGGETEMESAMLGIGQVWCLAPLNPQPPPRSPHGRGLLVQVTWEVQSNPLIVPAVPCGA